MDQEVELAPGAVDGRENSVHGRSVGDIAGDDEACAEFVGERFDSLLDRLALVGERQFGALCGTRLGDAPGDGTVVGDAHDEPAFARHQIAGYPGGTRRSFTHRSGALLHCFSAKVWRILHERPLRSRCAIRAMGATVAGRKKKQ